MALEDLEAAADACAAGLVAAAADVPSDPARPARVMPQMLLGCDAHTFTSTMRLALLVGDRAACMWTGG
jgi:hypothetical protein